MRCYPSPQGQAAADCRAGRGRLGARRRLPADGDRRRGDHRSRHAARLRPWRVSPARTASGRGAIGRRRSASSSPSRQRSRTGRAQRSDASHPFATGTSRAAASSPRCSQRAARRRNTCNGATATRAVTANADEIARLSRWASPSTVSCTFGRSCWRSVSPADGRAPAKADFAGHQDWLPDDGKGNRRATGQTLCFSNPDALAWFAENAANCVLASYRSADLVSIWPPDAGSMQLCRCVASVARGLNATDWYLLTQNAIRKRLTEKGWTGRLGWIAYHGTEPVPSKTPVLDGGVNMDFLLRPAAPWRHDARAVYGGSSRQPEVPRQPQVLAGLAERPELCRHPDRFSVLLRSGAAGPLSTGAADCQSPRTT